MNVLIPYNFSESAIRALNFTKKLFKNQPIKIVLLDVYISNKSLLLSTEQNKKWFNEVEYELTDELKYLIEILNREESTFIYEYKVDSNSLIKSIHKTILEKDINLIISGTSGVNNIQGSSKATNTLTIIENIKHCPIIVVPEKYKFKNINRLVFPTNFKRAFIAKELKMLTLISIVNNYSIEVLDTSKINELDNEQVTNKLQLQDLLDDLNHSNNQLKSRNLINYLEEIGDGLSVFTRYKLNIIERYFKEDLIKELTLQGNTPILVLPDFSK
ncbi:universal stress protein [Pseudofulvibacter geojedonensis]|uniref:Universal stress protein n=1 Tax=Pseudofulvibacter geojedonensis TaxID=1123758 RepID=A0ABW3I230_9FLAO